MALAWKLVREFLTWPRVAFDLYRHSRGTVPGLSEERVDFGPDDHQYVLLARPEGASADKPLVVFIHGGSWTHFSPAAFKAVGRFFGNHGYCTALLGYRLVPGAMFPAQLHDVLDGLAVALARPDVRAAHNGSVMLVGQSSGGQLAALMALDHKTRAERGFDDLSVAGLVTISGIVDWGVLCPAPMRSPILERYAGERARWDAADPAHFVHGADIPILCLHGSRDPLVPVEVSASFVLKANGAEGDGASLQVDQRARHGNMCRMFTGGTSLTAPLLEWIAGL